MHDYICIVIIVTAGPVGKAHIFCQGFQFMDFSCNPLSSFLRGKKDTHNWVDELEQLSPATTGKYSWSSLPTIIQRRLARDVAKTVTFYKSSWVRLWYHFRYKVPYLSGQIRLPIISSKGVNRFAVKYQCIWKRSQISKGIKCTTESLSSPFVIPKEVNL